MTIQERIDYKKDVLSEMVLFYQGGLFYNLYEMSAYVFCTRIKSFKTIVKTLKGSESPYVTIGVPARKIGEYLSGYDVISDTDGCLVVRLSEPVDLSAFQDWKKDVIMQESHDPSVSVSPNPANGLSVLHTCFREVRALNLATMTPMEALQFLNGLQVQLKDISL